MAFLRIQFADDAIGTNSYILPINPRAIQASDSKNITITDCVASQPVAYEHNFDDRPIIMTWKGLSSTNTLFSGLVSTLKGYVYSDKYIKLNSIQDMYRHIFTSTGWNGAYTIYNLELSTSTEGGTTWDDVKLTLYRKG